MRKHRWIRSSMETLSYMWTGHKAEERIGVKITRCPSQWLHSFPQKRAYLECVHSLLPALTLCLSLSAGPCCLHQSSQTGIEKAQLGFRCVLFAAPNFTFHCWISDCLFPFLPLPFWCHEWNWNSKLANPLTVKWHRAACSKPAHRSMGIHLYPYEMVSSCVSVPAMGHKDRAAVLPLHRAGSPADWCQRAPHQGCWAAVGCWAQGHMGMEVVGKWGGAGAVHGSRGSSVRLGQEPEAVGPWPQEGGMVLNCCLQELFFFFVATISCN